QIFVDCLCLLLRYLSEHCYCRCLLEMVWSCSWINTVFEKGSDCPSCLPSVRTNALCPTAPRQMKTSAIQRKRRDFFSLKLWMSYKFMNYINHYQCFKQKKTRLDCRVFI